MLRSGVPEKLKLQTEKLVRCAFSTGFCSRGWHWFPRLLARSKHACDQWHSARVITTSYRADLKICPNTEGNGARTIPLADVLAELAQMGTVLCFWTASPALGCTVLVGLKPGQTRVSIACLSGVNDNSDKCCHGFCRDAEGFVDVKKNTRLLQYAQARGAGKHIVRVCIGASITVAATLVLSVTITTPPPNLHYVPFYCRRGSSGGGVT
jgi:hypothetical protein